MSSILTFQLVIEGPAGGKRSFDIHPGTAMIGRQPGVTLLLDQQKISRNHAKIDCDGQECILTDLNSANGTLLNGKKLQPAVPYRLNTRDIITIGDYSLVFEQTRVEMPDGAPASGLELNLPVPEGGEPGRSAVTGEMKDKEPADEEALPPVAPVPPAEPPLPPAGVDDDLLPGSDGRSRFLINFLPESYHTDFMECFLGLFESILLPVEWTIDNFDLYLSPGSSPVFFLPRLENWFGLALDATWTDAQRRTLLAEAHRLYAMRGTRWALSRVLEIYTGQKPLINDTGEDLQPYTFTVRLSGKQYTAKREFVRKIIEENKPAHTTFQLEIEE